MIGDDTRAALDELVSRDDPSIVGLVLSGSAAGGDMLASPSRLSVVATRFVDPDV